MAFLLFCGINVFSQGEANNWYFGSNAGITFNNGAPEALLDGQLDTFEGCSSISDSSGNLLFYSDGISVWNRNHQVMPNGSGLLGSSSSTQSGLIAPYPGNPNLYYIFAIDLQAGPNGITYSLVDLSLDNGLGDITSEKNVLLYAPSTEKITAIKHTNSDDIWVITHRADTNEFYTYLIDDTGINLNPIISAIGYNPANEIDSAGYMKISPDGTRLAIAYSFSNILELFEFNASTGSISSLIQIDSLNPINEGSYIYGVEFSQNGELLYVSSLLDGIYQLDLSAYDAASISSSQLLIPPDASLSSTPPSAGLQLGPDGKIYVSHFDYGYLGVINNPDIQGVGCDYIIDGIFLEERVTFFGLPPFIQSFFSAFINANDTCIGNPIDFSVNTNQNIDSILWDFGDSNTAMVNNPSHTYNLPGTYTVSVTVTSGLQVITNTKTITIFDQPQLDTLTASLRQCDDDQDGFSIFNLNEANTELSLNFTSEIITYHEALADAENRSNPIENTTAYANETSNTDILWIRVENNTGCYSTAQLNLIVSTTQVPITFTRQFVACDDGEDITDGVATFDFSSVSSEVLDVFPAGQELIINYYRSESDALSELNPITDISNYENIGFPGQQDIFVRVDSVLDNDCLGYGPYIRLVVEPQPFANTVVDDFVCDDISNDGAASFVLSNYDIQVLQNQSPIFFEVLYFETELDALNTVNSLEDTHLIDTTSQTLFARIQNRDHPECFDITSFTLGISYQPIAYTPEDLSVCDNEGEGIAMFSLNAQDASILNGQSSMDHKITYHFTQNDAQSGENPLELNYSNIQNPQTIFARLENVNNRNCFDITYFDLVVIEQPILEMATQWSICKGDTLEIVGEPGYDEYLWSTGEITQNILVDTPGVYSLTVTNIDNDVRCEDNISIIVNLSTIASITNIETSDWTSNENTISIFVEGTGDYEYSIDNVTYQDSPIFIGLNAGDYSVYVRDKNGCGVVAQEVYLLSYPKFFTPNDDGLNDYWQLIGSNREPGNKLSIFNRYGKLITTLSPNNLGWDGTYNGKKMPSSDYWFVLERQNGRTYAGHFTLKR